MKRTVKFLVFLTLLILTGKDLHRLLIDDTQSYTRLMMHELYREKIDILFVGSSHCYAALDPAVTDPIFGKNTFNGGSSLQALDASFAVIREAAATHDLEAVYLELYFKMAENDDYQERTELTGTYLISDYMRPSLRKASFLLNASAKPYWLNGFLPVIRERENLFDFSRMRMLAAKKTDPVYRSYAYDWVTYPNAAYLGKGYVAGYAARDSEYYYDSAGFDRIHIENTSADWIRTLREIIAFCDKKGIRLTLFSAPMADFQLIGSGNYDEYITLAKSFGVPYFDFNLTRPEYWDPSPNYFVDAGHLSDKGASAFSELFAKTFTGKIPMQNLFYDSYEEKTNAQEPRLYGISFQDEGEEIRNLKLISTLPSGTDYRITMIPESAPAYPVVPNDSMIWSIPRGEQGICEITANGKVFQIAYN